MFRLLGCFGGTDLLHVHVAGAPKAYKQNIGWLHLLANSWAVGRGAGGGGSSSSSGAATTSGSTNGSGEEGVAEGARTVVIVPAPTAETRVQVLEADTAAAAGQAQTLLDRMCKLTARTAAATTAAKSGSVPTQSTAGATKSGKSSSESKLKSKNNRKVLGDDGSGKVRCSSLASSQLPVATNQL
jgi:hypothetical protein